jgi:hypothetical protein
VCKSEALLTHNADFLKSFYQKKMRKVINTYCLVISQNWSPYNGRLCTNFISLMEESSVIEESCPLLQRHTTAPSLTLAGAPPSRHFPGCHLSTEITPHRKATILSLSKFTKLMSL